MTYPPETREAVLEAVRAAGMISPAARAYGISRLTVTRWAEAARLPLASPYARQIQGARMGNQAARWPGCEQRQKRAQAMRLKGHTLAEIAAAVGLSVAGAHYASRPR